MTNENKTPGYKQLWPWFVFSFPILAVVAGIITYQIAANKPHSMVKDDYFKEGLAINQSIAKQAKARQLDISASLEIDLAANLLSVKLDGKMINSKILTVSFSHPTQEKLDQTLTLEKLSENEFIAEAPKLSSAFWHIRIFDQEQLWLLKTRWQYPKSMSLSVEAMP